MLSVCSFNGVKIGWWPHASPALNFSQKKTIRSYLFCFFFKLGALRKMKRWTLGAWVWTWCVWFSTLIKVLNGLRYRSWWKLICGQQQQDERNRRRTGDPVFFFNELFSKCYFFFSSLWLSLSEAAAGGNREKPWQWFLINLDRVRRHNGIQSSHCVSTPSKQLSPDSYYSSSFFFFSL